MKKIYAIISLVALAFTSHAATITVMVGQNAVGAAANEFNPASFTAQIGDDIVFTLFSGTHNVTNGSVPAGAAPINSPSPLTGSYTYNVTQNGTYLFYCSFHAAAGMGGGFTVSATGILDPATDLLTSAYPNPFKDKLTVKYSNIQAIEFVNVIGESVKKINLSATAEKEEIDFEGLPSGIYFYRTYNDGVIMETRKIVKAK